MERSEIEKYWGGWGRVNISKTLFYCITLLVNLCISMKNRYFIQFYLYFFPKRLGPGSVLNWALQGNNIIIKAARAKANKLVCINGANVYINTDQ